MADQVNRLAEVELEPNRCILAGPAMQLGSDMRLFRWENAEAITLISAGPNERELLTVFDSPLPQRKKGELSVHADRITIPELKASA